MNREIAKECLTNGCRITSEEEIDRFMKAFEQGTPIMPLTFFCDALRTWAGLFGAPPPMPEHHENEAKERRETANQIQMLFIKITKSNLLWRTLYAGEKPRKIPCPIHNGRWSGCKMIEDMECKGACADGNNVTGWLKE